MKFNFDSDMDTTRLPEGAYEAEIVDAAEVTSKQGTPGINVKFAVAHDGKTITVYDNLWATSKALPIVQQRLAAAGLPHNNEVDLAPSMLIGRHVVITIRHDEYQGEKKEKVYNWAPTGAPHDMTIDGDDIPF